MSRLPRPDMAGVPQHVIQRGNDRMPCFHDDKDRTRYLAVLGESATRYGCALHAFVLMTNHVHLLMTPLTVGAVPRTMQSVGRLFVAGFNARHQRTGTLWEGRYKSCLVDSERYVLACYRYIELNPVRASMVAEPGDYPWSSHAVNALGRDCPIVRPHAAFLALGPTGDARREAYRQLFREVLSETDISEIRAYIQQQRALGSDRFRAVAEQKLQRCLSVRAAHRPRQRDKAL